MDNNKTYCAVHHFFYSGKNCPFCLSDKTEMMAKKFEKKKENKKDNGKEATKEEIGKLLDKYRKS